MRASIWSEARHEELVALARSGASASQIAAQIGGTRNSIIGRCHRAGIKLGVGRPAPEPKAKPAPKPKAAPKPSLVRLPAWAAAKMAALEAEAPAHEPIPFIGRPALTCSQIIGDPKAQPSMCCGRAVHWRKVYGKMSASSYCADHFRRNTVPVQPRAPGPAYDANVQRVTAAVLMQARAFG